MTAIAIRASVLAAVIDHAKRDAPLECCGLLLGAGGTVDECVPAQNARHSATAYLIDPADHFAAVRRARARGCEIVGAYHSHPRSAAVPSATDLAEAHYSEFVYVIVSLAGVEAQDVRGYRLDDGRFVGVSLVTVP
jgi:proteasome lid subunit RPN8/RPN11